MRRTTGIALGLLVLGMVSGTPAQAGGESSAGGAEDYRVVPAFFRSYDRDKAVRACYEIAPGFGVEESALAGMILEAYRKWGEYIRLKRLTIVPGHNLIQTQLELRAKCQGDENLVFYFGVENEMIAKYRGQFTKPFGFAQLTGSTDSNYYGGPESKGFIWIAPSGAIDAEQMIPKWSPATQDALAGLVLHEVGHVFGNGHVDGTVMTDKIGKYLENDTSAAQASIRTVALYSKIDSQIELVPCMECHMTYLAAETFDPIQPPGQGSDWVRSFKLLTGKDPVPPLAIRYERLGSPEGTGRLTLMDAEGVYPVDVNVVSFIDERPDSTPLFYGQGGVSFQSKGIAYMGRIHTVMGTDLPVTVTYNMGMKKAQIKPLDDGFFPRPIFVSAD